MPGSHPAVGNSNLMFLPPFGVGQPGAPVQNGGGGAAGNLAMIPGFRDPMDAARSMMGAHIPSAEYPDGYLGTIQSRREDRMLNGLKARVTQRSYQRGVHKGERIDPQDYFWPPELTPMDGVDRGLEARRLDGVGPFMQLRMSPKGTVRERLTVLGQRLPRGSESLLGGDARKIDAMDRLRPQWS
jgi:hypothetical protein